MTTAAIEIENKSSPEWFNVLQSGHRRPHYSRFPGHHAKDVDLAHCSTVSPQANLIERLDENTSMRQPLPYVAAQLLLAPPLRSPNTFQFHPDYLLFVDLIG